MSSKFGFRVKFVGVFILGDPSFLNPIWRKFTEDRSSRVAWEREDSFWGSKLEFHFGISWGQRQFQQAEDFARHLGS